MTGTEWTKPGDGATVGDFDHALITGLCPFCGYDGELIDTHNPHAHATLDPTNLLQRAKTRLAHLGLVTTHTNLRLTGAPLTADDIRRIEQMEVTR